MSLSLFERWGLPARPQPPEPPPRFETARAGARYLGRMLRLAVWLVLASSAALAGDVRVVCSEGSTPYPTIQSAVNVAGDGDLIVVRPRAGPTERYDGFVVDGLGVTVVGLDGRGVRVREVRVRNVPLGATVTLARLEVAAETTTAVSPSGALTVEDCAGAVRIVDCRAAGALRQVGVDARFALDLTLVDCDVTGGIDGLGSGAGAGHPGLRARASRVAAYRSRLVGGVGAGQSDYFGDLFGTDGGAGADVGLRSFLWLGAAEVRGGVGGYALCIANPSSCGTLDPGDGGPGLVTEAGSLSVRLASTLAGGAPGETNGAHPGSVGAPEWGASTAVAGAQRQLSCASSTRSGQPLHVRVEGTPGEEVLAFVATDGWHRYLGPEHGVYSTRTLAGASPVTLGTIPAGGVLEATLDLPPAAPGDAVTYAVQASARTGPARFRLTPARMVTVLGDGAPLLEPGGVLYVDRRAPAGGHGTSWADALPDLRTALLAAPSADVGPTTQVWVAEGRYTPAPPGGERGQRFVVRAGVRLIGGFAGHETTLAERALGAHPVVLDGDLNGDDIPFVLGGGNRSDNLYRVVVLGDGGAGFFFDPSAPVNFAALEDVTIRGAESSTSLFGTGGGVVGFGRGRLVRCDVTENFSGGDGGGIEHVGQLELSHCRFTWNRAGREGGAVHLRAAGACSVLNCLFVANRAGEEGAGLYLTSGVLNGLPTPLIEVVCSTFFENRGGLCPGAIDAHVSVATRIVDNVLWSNGHLVSATVCELRLAGPRELRYNCIRGLTPLQLVDGNTDADPRFVDPLGPDGLLGTADDDLRLAPNSPLIDAGDNTAVPASVTVDLDGSPRFADHLATPTTGIGGTRVVDMGAYERL